MADAGFGLYIHWPFCQSKCPYCDFNSHVWDRIDQDRWCAAYMAEIDRVADETPDRILRSVFFGGGTPSLMPGETVTRILDRVRQRWRMTNDIEITLEANPTSVEAERFAAYRQGGVNRVSLGIQALDDDDLTRLGRLHSVDEALQALDVARSTFDRVSFDLIYARQDQSVEDWRQELGRALAFDPTHLSLYQLTIEDGTAFGDRFARGRLSGLPDEDRGADLWDVTQEMCEAAGLPGYEISNHAQSGHESRHNLIYWQGGDYAGIGPGAHGRLTLVGRRFASEAVRAPGAWLAAVEAGEGLQEQRESLSSQDIRRERVMMGLRIRDGIIVDDSFFNNKINDLCDLGLLERNRDVLRLTDRGRPVLDAVLRHLFRD